MGHPSNFSLNFKIILFNKGLAKVRIVFHQDTPMAIMPYN